MPILENGKIEYAIPANIKSMVSPEFCSQFLKELHIIFGVSVEDADMDYFVYQGGTSGWAVAFDTACRKLSLSELCKYYAQLPWYDSDGFDCDLADILVEQKLILGGFMFEEIARQNQIDKDLVQCCDKCGKYYHVDDMVRHEIDLAIECDNEPWIELYCKQCTNKETAMHLPFDINRTIVEILGKSPDNFFVCEKCGKTHYVAHRGEKHCLHCEQDVEDGCGANANNYYREELKEQEKYRDKVLGRDGTEK